MLATLVGSGCSTISETSAKCDDLARPSQQLSTGLFLANTNNPWVVIDSPQRRQVFESYALALQEILPSDFDPLDPATPEVDRLIGGLLLAALALNIDRTYNEPGLAEDWNSRFRTRYEQLIATCGYQ